MDIKETMIDFLLHQANDEQIEEFFGYAPHGFNREDIENILCQAHVFDKLVKELIPK